MRNVLQEVVKFKGIVKDIPPMELMEVPVWTEGRNVHFDDGSTHRVGGYGRMADALPAGAEPVFLHPVLTPDAAYWMYVSDPDTGEVLRQLDLDRDYFKRPSRAEQRYKPPFLVGWRHGKCLPAFAGLASDNTGRLYPCLQIFPGSGQPGH